MTMCELHAKIIAESELLQPALNEIDKFCFNIGPAAAVPAGPAPTPLRKQVNSLATLVYIGGINISPLIIFILSFTNREKS